MNTRKPIQRAGWTEHDLQQVAGGAHRTSQASWLDEFHGPRFYGSLRISRYQSMMEKRAPS